MTEEEACTMLLGPPPVVSAAQQAAEHWWDGNYAGYPVHVMSRDSFKNHLIRAFKDGFFVAFDRTKNRQL